VPKGISVAEAANRLTSAGIQFGDRYLKGASGKGGKWQSGASAAEGNYKEGVSKALASGAFGKGVSAAGASAYDQGVSQKGGLNWGTGMQAGGAKYQKNTAKFANLWTQPLSTPRGARGSANNMKRMSDNVARFQQAAA